MNWDENVHLHGCLWLYFFRLTLVLCFITLVYGQTTPRPGQFSAQHSHNAGPIIMQCFYEGRWFPAGTIISAGRSVSWCYGTYCDIDGTVKHWDDFNCRQSNSLPFPNVQQATTPTTTPQPPPTTQQPSYWYPTTQSSFASMGCFYEGRFYWAGADIYNRRRGPTCLGAYCDWNSQVQVWQDDCRYTMPPPQQPANTPIDRT